MELIDLNMPHFWKYQSSGDKTGLEWGFRERTNEEIQDDYVARAKSVIREVGLMSATVKMTDYD